MAAKLGMTNAELIDSINSDLGNVVTLNGNQTISGQKVFTTELRKKSTVIDITTQSENYTANNGFTFVDKNGKIMGYLENAQITDGAIKTGIHARNKDNYQQNLSVVVPQSGTTGAYATAPSTPANPGDTVIVTADYLKNNYVTLNTNQTITAQKNFSDSAQLVLLDSAARRLAFKSTVFDINAPAASQYYGILDFRDKNDYQVGRIDLYTPNTTDQTARIGCKNAAGNWSFLQVGWKNGAAYTTAPTPSVATNNTQIATTAYVNAKLQVVSALPANPNPNVYYFVTG